MVAHLPAVWATQTKMVSHSAMGKISRPRPRRAAMTASSSMTTQRLKRVNIRTFPTASRTITPIMDRTAAMEVIISNEDQVQPSETCETTLTATDRAVGPI